MIAVACVRSAWLVLGASTVQLENAAAGYFCQLLDLGWPSPRNVVTDRPDADGVIDRTQLFGSRAVSANITALTGAGSRIDTVAGLFAPFMAPSARPVLHYVLDRPGNPERTLAVRASGFSWPIVGDNQRDLQLQFVTTGDPASLDPNQQTATSWSGSGSAGRLYSLTFNRAYPVGSNSQTTGLITPAGDLPIKPLLRIYGPATAPYVTFTGGSGQPQASAIVRTLPGYILNAGDWLDIDCDRKTVYVNSDPTQSATAQIDWQNTTWPIVYPTSPGTSFVLFAGSASPVTQAQAIWNNRYLT